jgi:hypothetical protein
MGFSLYRRGLPLRPAIGSSTAQVEARVVAFSPERRTDLYSNAHRK